jgi:hypothetical protein
VLALVALPVCASLAYAAGSDRDSDGIHNSSDNCPKVFNPDQKDLDGDGKGDVCDPDRDGDGQLDPNDPCPDDALDLCVAPPPPPPDTTPPETTITDGPAEGSTITQAGTSFSFSSSEPSNATFQTRLDGGNWVANLTATSKTYSNLANGTHTFEVKSTDAAGNTDATPATRTWTVNATSQSGDPVFAGAGDIANCSSLAGAEATAKLLDAIPGTVYTLGDNAYGSGTATEFANCYDPTWGRHKARTRPAAGNHEYRTSGASGYFGYFGSAAGPTPQNGYYSYDLGQWHVVVLNTNDQCSYVSCAAGSAQAKWLQADLAAHPAQCTLAYFHHPLFTSGNYSPGFSAVKPLWDVLYSGGAEVVLNGHDHIYERFAPKTPSGAKNQESGIREFVVGTGGAEHYGINTVQPYSEVRNTGTFGVLKLTLHPTSYDWQFVPEAGKTFTDSGSTSCH